MLDQVFVQSRGISPESGYSWQPHKPDRLGEFSQYTQLEDFSILLNRQAGRLFLLITGLESPEKRDFRGRTIGHSVFWVFENSLAVERKVRAMVIQALEDRAALEQMVDQCISLDNQTGFKISQDLSNLPLGSLLGELGSRAIAPHERKIAKNSLLRQQDLVQELRQHCFPEGNGWLLIVTELKSEAALKGAEPWRGLSSLVTTERWQVLKKTSYPTSSAITITLGVVVVLFVLLILIVMTLTPRTDPDPQGGRLPETVNPTESTLENATGLEQGGAIADDVDPVEDLGNLGQDPNADPDSDRDSGSPNPIEAIVPAPPPPTASGDGLDLNADLNADSTLQIQADPSPDLPNSDALNPNGDQAPANTVDAQPDAQPPDAQPPGTAIETPLGHPEVETPQVSAQVSLPSAPATLAPGLALGQVHYTLALLRGAQ